MEEDEEFTIIDCLFGMFIANMALAIFVGILFMITQLGLFLNLLAMFLVTSFLVYGVIVVMEDVHGL